MFVCGGGEVGDYERPESTKQNSSAIKYIDPKVTKMTKMTYFGYLQDINFCRKLFSRFFWTD